MSAAYDLCNHQIMTEKCRILRLGKNAVDYIAHFLSERSQFVELGGSCSATLNTGPNGVVQGGKSSGELFLYYLNDLPHQLALKIAEKDKANSVGKEYVDDISILSKANTLEDLKRQIQFDFLKVKRYLVNHRMVINADKSQLMYLHPPKEKVNLELRLDGNVINHQETMKILGVTLAESMKFDSHLVSGKKCMTQAINAKTAVLRTVKPFISSQSLALVGASLVNSTVLYAAPLWGSTSKTNMDKIQAAQIRAARVITSKSWQRSKQKEHRQETLNSLNWPNVNQIVTSAILNLTKKATSNKSSEGLNNMFKVFKPQNQRGEPTSRVEHKGKSNKKNDTFSVNASVLFNSQTQDMKNPLLTIKRFKSKLKKVSRETNLLPTH